MLRIAVIEQNEFMKERLLGHIRQFSEKEVPCTSVVFTDELEFLESYNFTFDVVLVAVGLRLFDGVEIAKKIRARDERVEIVFVAQDDANAIDGYAVDAADYLLYPVGYDRFAAAMRRANARLARKQGGAFIVKVKGVYRRLLARDILFVEVRGHYLAYHLNNETIVVIGQLAAVEDDLADCSFFRCSAAYMINLRSVDRYTRKNVYIGGQEIRVSRAKKEALFSLLARDSLAVLGAEEPPAGAKEREDVAADARA